MIIYIGKLCRQRECTHRGFDYHLPRPLYELKCDFYEILKSISGEHHTTVVGLLSRKYILQKKNHDRCDIIFNTSWTLSADPQVLWIRSLFWWWKKLLNASVVFFTLTFSEPILRKPKSLSEKLKNINYMELFCLNKTSYLNASSLTWFLQNN